MIPTARELQEISDRTDGDLAEVPFEVLLWALAVHGRTQVVELRRRQVAKKIVLEAGVPVDCRSNLVHETLGRFLETAGKLSAQDSTACQARAASLGVPLGEVLVAQGLVSPFELFKLLQQNLAKKLLDLFTWREGEFRMLPERPHVDSSLQVRVPQLIVTGISKLAPQEEVDAAVVPLVGKRLALDPAFPLAELRLSQRQALLTDALARGLRMDELAEATSLPHEEITRLLYALAVLGAVVPAERLRAGTGALPLPPSLLARKEPAPAPAAAPEGSAAPAPPAAAPPPPAADLERLRNEVMQAYLSYRKQDAFDLLGVPEDATLARIDERFLDFAERFAPWRFAGQAELAEKARDLFLAGALSYGQLAERESRETLLFRRKTLREERERRPAPDSFAIKTDLLDPEVQYRKGRAAMDAGKWREAAQLLEFAADCDPQNGLYRAELAWARFNNSPGTAGKQAVRELEEAQRIDPRCGLAFYYLGEIHREQGNAAEAEPNLQKAIKLMAPDRRPIEALKTLQLKKKR